MPSLCIRISERTFPKGKLSTQERLGRLQQPRGGGRGGLTVLGGSQVRAEKNEEPREQTVVNITPLQEKKGLRWKARFSPKELEVALSEPKKGTHLKPVRSELWEGGNTEKRPPLNRKNWRGNTPGKNT